MNNRNAPNTTMKGVAKLLFLLFSFFPSLIISNGVDTITTTQFLTNKSTLVSSGGTFELGFFSSDNRSWFLGIWYKKISTRTVVWIANRDTPLNDTSDIVLKINEKGFLSLLNNTNTTIWFANSSRITKNPVARLLESGNLVVEGENDDDNDPDNYLWQSFDHPTDTFMPGMKLGMNFVTEVNRFLSNGNYTYGMDPHGFPQLTLEKDSVKQFTTGPWNGVSFSGTPGLKPNNIYKYDFVFNKEEVYYIFSLVDPSVYSRMVLSDSGVVHRFTCNDNTGKWVVYLSQPQDDCDFFGSCHGYGICNINKSPVCGCLDKFEPKNKTDWDRTDWSGGCVRRTPLDYKNGDGFVKYSGIKLPDTSHSWYDKRMNLEECKYACLKNCTCMAYANSDIRGSGCLLWFEDLIDMRVLTETGQDIYLRMASSEVGSKVGSNRKRERRRMQIGLALLAVVLLIALSLTLLYARKKKTARKQQKQQQLEHLQKERITESQTEDLELPLFDLATISDATMNFSVNNMLGEGGFGPVYKGKLEEGQEIAVKQLSVYSAQGLDEFKNEVMYITKLQHRNLVRLLGCCIQGQEKMLIYEYMPNNSLDSFLFGLILKTIIN